MRPAADFWFSLAHLARLIQHASGPADERHARVVGEFTRLGPLGRQTALEELHVVLQELTSLEHELRRARFPANNGKQCETEWRQAVDDLQGPDDEQAPVRAE